MCKPILRKLLNIIYFLLIIIISISGLILGFLLSTMSPSENVQAYIINVSNFNIKEHRNFYGKTQSPSGLVYVVDEDPTIIIDLKYATTDNFTGKKIYPYSVCMLQKNTMKKLINANKEFKELGYTIKIWDAYRPSDVQKNLWELVKDRRFIADPNLYGSRHNRGAAVDITLVDSTGRELEMPTKFDEFNEKAFRNSKMSDTARINLDLLTTIMVKNGFKTIETEWWHYDDSDADSYPILNIPLEELK